MVASLLLLALVLLVVGTAISAVAVWMMARALLTPPRMSDGKAAWVLKRISPGDLGMAFEDVRFTVRDLSAEGQAGGAGRINLAAWWVPCTGATPAGGGRCAVLLHGYADAKVGAIAWAPTFHALGYHVLAVDLRAHGQSGGEYSTAGFYERHDVSQAIDEFKAAKPDETRHLVLFGVSLGAAVAAATAALRDDVAGVVLESPYGEYRAAALAQGRGLGMPGAFFPSLTFALAGRLARADFDAVATSEAVAKLACPVMIVQGENDPLAEGADAERLRAAAGSRPAGWGPTVLWRAEGAGHAMALVADPEEYRRRVGAFLELAEARQGAAQEKTLVP